MTKPVKIIIWILVIVVIGGIAYYVLRPRSSEPTAIREIVNQECLNQGGQVVERETSMPPEQACPEGTEFVGRITDLRCFCVCCK